MLRSDSPPRLKELDTLKEELDYDYLKEDLLDLISQSKEGVARVSNIMPGLKEFAISGDQDWTSIGVNRTIKNVITSIDKQQKEDISVNLNAVQAIERSGTIQITTYLNDDRDKIKIENKDSGVGMEEKAMAKIFEPFFTTKEAGSGAGLWLSMAYGIIKAHHGFIEIASQQGSGSTFCVELPTQFKQ